MNVISDPTRKHIEVNVENSNGTSGHSNGTVWRTNNSRLITMRVKGRNIDTIGFVMSHEFGHAIGLKDAYDAKNNSYYAPVSSSEIYYDGSFNQYEAGEIMYHNGRVLANDIEMVLYAYSENQYQVFVPYYAGNTLNISKAIKERQKQCDPISKFDESAFEFMIEKIVVINQNELEFHIIGGLKFTEKIC